MRGATSPPWTSAGIVNLVELAAAEMIGWFESGQTVGGSVELGNQCRRPRSRAAMLISIRVLNEQLTDTGFTGQLRS
jgi:hypothetical protein